MHTSLIPKTTTQCNVTVSATSGSSAPYSGYVQLGARFGNVRIRYNTLNVRDRVLLKKDGVAIFDSGCVGTGGEWHVTVGCL